MLQYDGWKVDESPGCINTIYNFSNNENHRYQLHCNMPVHAQECISIFLFIDSVRYAWNDKMPGDIEVVGPNSQDAIMKPMDSIDSAVVSEMKQLTEDVKEEMFDASSQVGTFMGLTVVIDIAHRVWNQTFRDIRDIEVKAVGCGYDSGLECEGPIGSFDSPR